MRRPRVRYSELTSLLDVLFIVVFAALVQASGLVARARRAPPKEPPRRARVAPARPATPAPDAGVRADAAAVSRRPRPLDPRALRRRAAAAVVAASLRSGVVLRVQVSATGRISHLTVKTGGQERSVAVDIPLLERVPDPNVGVAYLGHKSAALRVCTAVRRALGWPNLREALVLLQPAVGLARLQVALVEGLRADQQRCYPEERGLAVIVDPEVTQGKTIP